MIAWVSPPQDNVSHMVEVAAIIAHAASTAFPPCSKILAPAVAASGLPVTAIQCRPCSARMGAALLLGGAVLQGTAAPEAQARTQKPALHGRHWMAVTVQRRLL